MYRIHPQGKMGWREHSLPPVFPRGEGTATRMVTQRLSVMAKQEMGTARAKDKFFDLNGIETQTRSEAIG